MSTPYFRRYAWFFLAYLIAVILFGAWVRISGSGDGCGSHWPTCHGEVVPVAAEGKTLIEYTHRVTSGLCGIFGLALVFWARRLHPALFHASLVTMFFLLVEGLIGAVLVKKELVAGDASVSRAIVVSLHLANTLLLTASAATVVWWAEPRRKHAAGIGARGLMAAALFTLVLTNMTGAVTALGDTLFPTRPAIDGGLLARISDDFSPSHHFLVRLRIVHPVIAVVSAAFLAAVLLGLRKTGRGAGTVLEQLIPIGLLVVGAQVGLGVLNVALAAPGWMQIVHLLAAQVVWMAAWFTMLSLYSNPGARKPAC